MRGGPIQRRGPLQVLNQNGPNNLRLCAQLRLATNPQALRPKRVKLPELLDRALLSQKHPTKTLD